MSRALDAWPLVAPLVRAVDALLAGDAVDIAPLLPIARAARLAGYANAGADTVDVAAVADVLRRRPGILHAVIDEALHLVDDTDALVGPRRHRAARLLVDALILALESTKLRFGLRPSPAALKAVFDTADEARAVLAAVAAVPAVVVVQPLPAPSTQRPPDLAGVHLVVGPAARRLQDMLSHAIRRLRVDLALLGRRNTIVDDDDVYRGAAILDDEEPGCRQERLDKDADEGVIVDDGRSFVVDTARLQEELVDRRLRSLLLPLKKARAVIVGVVDDDHLDMALALTPRSVQVVVAGSAVSSSPWLVDAASGAITVGDPDEPIGSLSVPSPLLVPDDNRWDDGAWRLLQAIQAARLTMPLVHPRTRSGDDLSALCAVAVAAMVPVAER